MNAEASKWENGEICRENPEKGPVFHARNGAEMNTIKRKKRQPLPRGGNVL
jgi:hypothetical protein